MIPTIEPFLSRHLGISMAEQEEMLQYLGLTSLDELIDQTIPKAIQLTQKLPIGEAMSESEYLQFIRHIMDKNQRWKSYIGMGYYGTHTPTVIQRNIFENPGWYTQYTPYQAEIAQGRLEALLNFQTMVSDLMLPYWTKLQQRLRQCNCYSVPKTKAQMLYNAMFFGCPINVFLLRWLSYKQEPIH